MKKIYLLLSVILFGTGGQLLAQPSTFFYTGAVQYWTVPNGVHAVTVDAKGAEGGMVGPMTAPVGTTVPGKGGRVQATLTVVPGTILNVYVGQAGGPGSAGGSVGGYNGGGSAAGRPFPVTGYSGGGGGGATDIRAGGIAFANRVIVASGGGGAGYNSSCPPGPLAGGDGGGLTGSGTTSCLLAGYTITNTGGGTQIAGGAGGNLASTPPLYSPGFPGVLGIGGSTDVAPNDPGLSGGGGGGYYGGGAGCWMGGGGGSSYADAILATGVIHTPGFRSGNGEISICITSPGIIVGPTNMCSGQTIALTDSVGSGSWTSSNTFVATVGLKTGIVSGLTAGIVNITYTINSCTIMYAVTTLHVIQSPLPISGTTPVCAGTTTTYMDATPGGYWTSSNTAAATIGSVSGIVSGVYPGAATITYNDPTGGCFSTLNMEVHGITGTTRVCNGSSVPLGYFIGTGAWSSSNTAVATVGTSGVVSGLSIGTSTISYSDLVCPSAIVMHVNPIAPNAGFDSVCVGNTVFVSNIVGGGNWKSSNATIASVGSVTGLVTGISGGTATLSYLLPTGCLSQSVVNVIPPPPPITGFPEMCPGKTTSLTDAMTGGVWSSSNVFVATVNSGTGVVTGLVADTTSILYTIRPGCSSYLKVTVNPLPFPIIGGDTLCPGVTDTLHNASIGGLWTTSTPSLDTIVDSTGIITTRLSGTAVVTYTLPTGCARSKNLYIYPIPPQNITYDPYTNTLYTAKGYPKYQWYDSIGGAIKNAKSPSLAATYTQWYYVVITDTNGCLSRSNKYYHDTKRVGVNSVGTTVIRMYPNPTTGIVFIESPVKVRAIVSGTDGKVIIEQTDAREVNVSGLANAVYFISLYDESGQLMTVQKLVKD